MTDVDTALADRDDRVGFLFETAGAAVLAVEPDGTVVDANERAVDLLGSSREALLSSDVVALEADPAGDLADRCREVTSDESLSCETTLDRTDGDTVPVEATVRSARLDGRERLVLVCRDLRDRRELERATDRYESIVGTLEDGVYALDADLQFSFVNDALCRLTGHSREELLGSDVRAYFEYDDEAAYAAEIRRRVVEGDTDVGTIKGTVRTKNGPRTLESRYRLHPEPEGEFRGSVGVIRDVSEREARERTLRRQRDELGALDRLNELILETVRELIQTSSREAVELTVCERVAAGDPYRLAWIGERGFDSDDIVPRVVAGEAADYLEAVSFAVGDGSPAARAIETGAVQVARVEEPAFEPWREAARTRGVATVTSVPLRHEEHVYGVLEVCSTRLDSFGDRELAGLDALGRTVGLVVYAARNRALLFTDSVVELEFDVTGANATLVDGAVAADGTCELDGYVPVGDEWLCYLTVSGASPDAVLDVFLEEPGSARGRVIADGEDAGTIELAVDHSPLLSTVSALGGTVGRLAAGPDGVRVDVDVPADRDARAIVERITDAVAGAEFVSHRERDHDVRTLGRPDGVLANLTDRQREALTAAYRAGYFAWPRDSSAEEVADALGIDRSTLHAHLRKAQAHVLEALIDGRSSSG